MLLVTRLEKEILLKAAQLKTERQSHKQSLSNLHEQLQASSMKIQEMTQLTQDYQALQTGVLSIDPLCTGGRGGILW